MASQRDVINLNDPGLIHPLPVQPKEGSGPGALVTDTYTSPVQVVAVPQQTGASIPWTTILIAGLVIYLITKD